MTGMGDLSSNSCYTTKYILEPMQKQTHPLFRRS
jgi:hypothetical protein